MYSTYRTVTGRTFDLTQVSPEERRFLREIVTLFRATPDWNNFAAKWTSVFDRFELPDSSPAYRIAQDLEARLGIVQGKVAPPDYRDSLADLIAEHFGSRYKFCQATGVDAGHLSRVLAGRADLSLDLLRQLQKPLHAVMILEPERSAAPEEAERALAVFE